MYRKRQKSSYRSYINGVKYQISNLMTLNQHTNALYLALISFDHTNVTLRPIMFENCGRDWESQVIPCLLTHLPRYKFICIELYNCWILADQSRKPQSSNSYTFLRQEKWRNFRYQTCLKSNTRGQCIDSVYSWTFLLFILCGLRFRISKQLAKG